LFYSQQNGVGNIVFMVWGYCFLLGVESRRYEHSGSKRHYTHRNDIRTKANGTIPHRESTDSLIFCLSTTDKSVIFYLLHEAESPGIP